MSSLEIKQVEKTYPNGKYAIKGVNASIESGEFVVFVGPSGCGKSTLLRMIAGLEDISNGEIELEGKVINKLDPAERDIAMVFQNYALYPHMSVYKNLAYGLVNRKYPKDEIYRRVQEAAKMLQLTEYLESKPSELSGGQRQRVAMGRAIVREPKLFLFDEPLSNLDAKLRNTMRLEIKTLQRRLKTTAIYVTHDQVEAMTMADKIVLLNQGNIEQIGSPRELYHNPANAFVATFIGSPAMNILQGTIVGQTLVFEPRVYMNLPFSISDFQQNTPIQLGLRPECAELTTSPKNGSKMTLPVNIEAVEDLGHHRVLHCKLGSQPLLVVSDLSEFKLSKQHYLSFEFNDLYLFDADKGTNISHYFK